MWKFCRVYSLFLFVLLSQKTFTASFEDCPTKAFLIQKPSSIPKTFAIDLSTGNYDELSSNMGTTSSYNGVGFNNFDDYLYGWNHADSSLAKVGSDYQIEAITIDKTDAQSQSAGNFVAGDVSLTENTWFGYRKNKGLFKVYLEGENQYDMVYVAGSADKATISLTDLAFHPSDGFIYAVTNGTQGKLYKIAPSSGDLTELGVVYEGDKAVFGAQFFDVDGNLYISNNKNGYIYKLDIIDISITSDVFSYGPVSSSNDGARCASAEIVVGDSIDFGDAPASYGTAFEDNGARHELTTSLRLGTAISSETEPNYTGDGDDGISFPVGFESSSSSRILATVDGLGGDTAYLNAWFDWDRDGTFDDDEQAIVDYVVSAENDISLDVPIWAEAGDIWSRFRLSTLSGIGPTGGVSNGEVEDYELPMPVTESGVSIIYYPSSSTFSTIAYEDFFPWEGDYDMNDSVMKLRITEYIQGESVIRVGFEGRLASIGALYGNGFAVRLEGVTRSNVREDSISWSIDGVVQEESPLEADMSEAIVVFSTKLDDHVDLGGCLYFRAEEGCSSTMTEWSIRVPFTIPVANVDMPDFPYDPFIFSSPSLSNYHGDEIINLIGGNPGRGYEIHLKNKPATEAFNTIFYGAIDDVSNVSEGKYFMLGNGMSWSIEIPHDWAHPLAGQRLDDAYPGFVDFAGDETGATNSTWYLSPDTSKVYSE